MSSMKVAVPTRNGLWTLPTIEEFAAEYALLPSGLPIKVSFAMALPIVVRSNANGAVGVTRLQFVASIPVVVKPPAAFEVIVRWSAELLDKVPIVSPLLRVKLTPLTFWTSEIGLASRLFSVIVSWLVENAKVAVALDGLASCHGTGRRHKHVGLRRAAEAGEDAGCQDGEERGPKEASDQLVFHLFFKSLSISRRGKKDCDRAAGEPTNFRDRHSARFQSLWANTRLSANTRRILPKRLSLSDFELL